MDFYQFKENAEASAKRMAQARERGGNTMAAAKDRAREASVKRLDRADPRGAKVRARHAAILGK